jgi:chemotaxis protein CheD
MSGANRYWEASTSTWLAPVLAGDFYVSRNDEIITTVLGSCVATCVRDPEAGIGGINHFLLPEEPTVGRTGEASTRYGLYALERLLNTLTRHGARREALEIKIFGGGRVLSAHTDIGRLNVDFVRQYLENEGLSIAAEDVGHAFARRLRYHPLSGSARVLRMPMRDNRGLAEQENERARELIQTARRGGDIELF